MKTITVVVNDESAAKYFRTRVLETGSRFKANNNDCSIKFTFLTSTADINDTQIRGEALSVVFITDLKRVKDAKKKQKEGSASLFCPWSKFLNYNKVEAEFDSNNIATIQRIESGSGIWVHFK